MDTNSPGQEKMVKQPSSDGMVRSSTAGSKRGVGLAGLPELPASKSVGEMGPISGKSTPDLNKSTAEGLRSKSRSGILRPERGGSPSRSTSVANLQRSTSFTTSKEQVISKSASSFNVSGAQQQLKQPRTPGRGGSTANLMGSSMKLSSGRANPTSPQPDRHVSTVVPPPSSDKVGASRLTPGGEKEGRKSVVVGTPAGTAGGGTGGPPTRRGRSLSIGVTKSGKKLSLLVAHEVPKEEEYYVGGLFDIDHSPAFKVLDQLRTRKEASEQQIEEYKSKMRDLHNFLLSCFEYEKTLTRKAKQLSQEVTNQRMEMDRTGTKQFSDNSQIGELKREYHKIQNEVQLASEREQRLQKDIQEAEKQKQELINDIEEIRRHKADMLEPQLIASTKELKIELSQRRQQVENLQKDLEEKMSSLESIVKEKERLELDREKHSIALAKATEMPQKIMKQSDILRDAINSLVAENARQTTIGQQLDKELERLAKKRKDLEELKLDQQTECDHRRNDIHELERKCDEIFKEHEMSKEQLTYHKAERVRLEMTLKRTNHDIKKEHESLLRAIRDKESQLKQYRRLETTVNNVRMTTPILRQQNEEYQRQLEATQREAKTIRATIADLKKEIDLALFEFLKQQSVEKTEMDRAQALYTENRKLHEELERAETKFADMNRKLDQLKAERELKHKHKVIKEDFRAKEIAANEAEKRCMEAENRLRDFATMYDIVKNERNQFLNQIQATTQRAAEMKEKIKILSNEIEILRQETMNKERELTKKRQDNSAAYALRDSAKNEANKLLAQYREKRDQIDQYLARIENLNLLINAAEEDMLALKSRYALFVKDRNKVGLSLLERNDELCILYEKINVHDSVLQRGEAELRNREDDIRKLGIVTGDLRREVEVLKKRKPLVGEYEGRLNELETELDEIRSEGAKLGDRMENPEDPDRCRYLGGEDLSQNELMEKIKNMEELLAEKEEKILEKDLILEEVTTLTERLKSQTLAGRQESNEVATHLNELAKKIKQITRVMMAKVSELSMQQALATSLYQEKTEKEALMSEAQLRLNNGEIPLENIDQDLKRAGRARVRREREVLAMTEKREREMHGGMQIDEDGFYVVNNSLRTAATPRPNAYVPDTLCMGELPIPKPYGNFGPFKPTEAGSQMRHFRKPVLKPIEI
ncbi:hypothetical protein HK102_009803 [Quaeritorhiza haematococci]|nr:hypothetical protein HK102_009803 [Quaeritorhiza haematococci]